MISEGKSNSDVIDELLDMMSKGEKITLNDIDEIISTRSIVDTKAAFQWFLRIKLLQQMKQYQDL